MKRTLLCFLLPSFFLGIATRENTKGKLGIFRSHALCLAAKCKKGQRVMKKDATFWIVLVISIIAIIPLALIDFAMAWLLTRPIDPSVFIRYAWPYLLIMSPFVIFRFSKQKIGVVMAFLFLVALIYFMPWSSRKPFLRDLYSLKPGMTVAEVETKMRGYMKGSGVPWPPILDDTPKTLTSTSPMTNHGIIKGQQGEIALPDSIIYRHSSNEWFNADWGVVNFRDGRVESVEFLPD